MGKRTSLYETHVADGARIVDFVGWDMPVDYGSQIDEHHHVRRDAGMFDVSHMTVVDLHGMQTRDFLRQLLANNVDRLQEIGKALYTCMLNEDGGVIDDLIVYFMGQDWFRVVVNAGTHDKDLAWITAHAKKFGVEVKERDDLAMIAVQGPKARERVHEALDNAPEDLRDMAPFYAHVLGDMFIARTGYTGEDGYEIMLPADRAAAFWDKLKGLGVKPCGLGARDTLRLEAGMNLYGTDMDETVTPLESALGWTVAWDPEDREFIGRDRLENQRRETAARKLVGIILEDKGVLRDHLKVYIDGLEAGEVTSGSFSPTLGKAIGFARVPRDARSTCTVEVRGKQLSARIVKPPFVRNGKPCL